jgi:hypothetical protein
VVVEDSEVHEVAALAVADEVVSAVDAVSTRVHQNM